MPRFSLSRYLLSRFSLSRFSLATLFHSKPQEAAASPDHENADFQLKVQYQAFNKQLPLMYIILLLNTWILSSKHHGTAPLWLTLDIPIVLSLICIVRLGFWFKMRNEVLTPELVKRRMRHTNLLAAPISLAFTAWAVMMFHFGDTIAKYHIAAYTGLTLLCCMLCLMHIRLAALIVTAIANASFILLFVSSNEEQTSVLGILLNVGMSLGGVMLILYFYYRDFVHLIQAQVRAESLSRENFRLANIDSLTELPNRRKFFHDLEWHCSHKGLNQHGFALAILDLDGFKPVNDLYGHGTGDKLLYAVSRRLENHCGKQATVSRMGGDEFAIIISANMNEPELLAFCTELGQALRSPYSINNHIIHISASIGLAIYPHMAESAHDLYEYADYALYHGKRSERSDVTLFSGEHRKLIVRDANIEQALRRADLPAELTVFFQPINALPSQRTVAFEALARWHSSELGIVSPALFIPIAEHAGLINEITITLLAKALQVLRSWPEDIRLSFNLSAHDIGTRRVVERIMQLILQSGVAADRLDFEITETAALHDIAQVKWSSEQLRDLGCGITLDDFGTGYSSFRQLHELPLTKIKIDRCFVRDIHTNILSRKIVQSLMTLSREMQIQCVLEGVENEDELACLKSMGAELAQGYYFSPPVPESVSLTILDAQGDILDFNQDPEDAQEAGHDVDAA